MKLSNVLAIFVKNLQQIRRDPRMIGLSVMAPIIVTTLFGFAFGGDLTDLKVYIVNDDENFNDIFARDVINEMDTIPKIDFNTSTSDPVEVKKAVDNNHTQAAIIFPSTFTEDLILGVGAEVELYVSYNNTSVADYIVSAFQSSFGAVLNKYFGNPLVTFTIIPVYNGTSGPLPDFINISLSNRDLGWAALNNKLSEDVLDILEEDDTVDIIEVSSMKKYEDHVKKGKAHAIIKFSEYFTYDALINKEINIKIKLDGAEPQASMAIVGALSSALSEAFEDKFDKSVFEIDEYYYNNIDGTDDAVESITYFTPAIIGYIVFFFAFLLTMLAFLRERKLGTMERILTSPMKRSEIILGYILSYSLIALIQAVVIISVAIFAYNAQIQFSIEALLQAALVIYLLLLAALGMGILLSTLAKSEFQATQFIPLVVIPTMLLSGVWAPVETLPIWLRPLSSIIPLTHANNAMRNILIRGQTLSDVWFEIGILMIFASLMIFLGIISLNKKLK